MPSWNNTNNPSDLRVKLFETIELANTYIILVYYVQLEH